MSKIKYLRINLTKDMKNLYTENCKTLIKEYKDDSKKWKAIHGLGLVELILLNYHTAQSNLQI